MKKKIGWQKYEDALEKQLTSPLMQMIMEQFISQEAAEPVDSGETWNTDNDDDEDEKLVPFLSISNELAQDAALVSNFDCWIGHTNFDITPSVLTVLNEADGVEVLKLCSRYRFFIGVGKMFDFKTVRKTLETKIT